MAGSKEKGRLTSRSRDAISQELRLAAENLNAGNSVCIEVPDFDVARELVGGDDPLLTFLCEDRKVLHGDRITVSGIKFIIGDFASSEEPGTVLRSVLKQIPNFNMIKHNDHLKFADLYPGVFIALIGVDVISQRAEVDDIQIIARLCPCVLIHKAIPYGDDLNISVMRTIGRHAFCRFIIK